MALWIQISPGSHEHIYIQIAERISEAIAKQEISTGDRLPAVRKLAAELLVNPNTVARAYTVLEQSRLVTTKTGSGTFVSDPKLRSADAADLNALTERIDTVIARGLNVGIDSDKLVAIFKDRVSRFSDKTESGNKEDD
ncbi:MAG: GntR family transcriptional regulator [Planctomycetota bacterium]